MTDSLVRFIEAQDNSAMYERAIKELTDGRKNTHWIWFIFPQTSGIGSSHNATYYGIQGIEEAKDYVKHPLLGPRYVEAMYIVHQKLLNERVSLLTLMSAEIDCLKFTSSLTLFSAALEKLSEDNSSLDANLMRLEKYIHELVNSKQIGTFPCQRTRDLLS